MVEKHSVEEGHPVQDQHAVEKVEELINNHLEANGKLNEIVVLTSDKDYAESVIGRLRNMYRYSNVSSGGPVSSYFAGYPKVDQCLIVESVERFSGMERPVVIVLCVSVSPKDNYRDTSRLKFQSITRAMSKVYIIDYVFRKKDTGTRKRVSFKDMLHR